MYCQKCGVEVVLPFQCPYCGAQFCSEHRLPENHNCAKIDQARAKLQQNVLPQNYDSFRYSYSYGAPIKSRSRINFSPKEIKHITVAALLVIGIGFSIGLYDNILGAWTTPWNWSMMTVFAFLITISFLTHELAHKAVAQKKGLWAEFRLTMWGAILTCVSIFIPFKMIAPGAMMISGSPNGDAIVKISLAGPVTNMIFSVGILGVAFAFPNSIYVVPLLLAAYFNAFIALFNLIPFSVLDGQKIFSWNKWIWLCSFLVSAGLTLITYLLIYGI